jgi:hypothetical protein
MKVHFQFELLLRGVLLPTLALTIVFHFKYRRETKPLVDLCGCFFLFLLFLRFVTHASRDFAAATAGSAYTLNLHKQAHHF